MYSNISREHTIHILQGKLVISDQFNKDEITDITQMKQSYFSYNSHILRSQRPSNEWEVHPQLHQQNCTSNILKNKIIHT